MDFSDEFEHALDWEDKEFDRKRKEANIELMQILGLLIVENPSQRFSQILVNYGFVESEYVNIEEFDGLVRTWSDEFGKEPQEVLKRVRETIKEMEE